MKPATSNAEAQLAANPVEPIIIVGIQWEVGVWSYYSNYPFDPCFPTLLEVGDISQELNTLSAQMGSVQVKLDNSENITYTDLADKDLHKIKASIFFLDRTLTFDDKITIFEGEISSPMKIDETDKTITFDIVNQIESFEVGFSPEAGQFDFVPEDLEGVPWPLGFGEPKYAPAVQVTQIAATEMETMLTIIDSGLLQQREQLIQAIMYNIAQRFFWVGIINQNEQLIEPILARYRELLFYENNIIEPNFNSVLLERERLLKELEEFVIWIQLWPNDPNKKDANATWVELIDSINATTAAINAFNEASGEKAAIEFYTPLYQFKQQVKKNAAQKWIQLYSQEIQLLQELAQVEFEICQQARTAVLVHRVVDSYQFEQNTPVEVLINNVKFLVSFNNKIMTILGGPLPFAQNLTVNPWTPDDEPCSDHQIFNGVNLFYCDTPNLTGKYCLVKRKGSEQRHIVKINSQVGDKVYFDLVPFDTNRSQVINGLDIDTVINNIVETPLVNFFDGQGGVNLIPAGYNGWFFQPAGVYTENFNPAIWNLPQSQRYLDLLEGIDNPTDEEKRTLATLVFLAPYDYVREGLILIDPVDARKLYTIIGPDIDYVESVSAIMLPTWIQNYTFYYEEIPTSNVWRAEPGAKVQEFDTCTVKVVNILPSEIRGVYAYRRNTLGERYLAPVPSRYYEKYENYSLGTMSATLLIFPIPIELITGESWEAEIYVTYKSSVGPNIVDIMEYLITTYTDKTFDTTTFNTVKTHFGTKYPANFVIYDQPNALELLNQIAWEARCSLMLTNQKFYLKYLSYEENEVFTVEDEHVILKSHSYVFERTEKIVTKYTAIWKPNYLPERERKVIVRYNIGKYGLHKQTHNFLIFDDYLLVFKSITFWLIRDSNTFKRVMFDGTYDTLLLDLHDTILLDTFIDSKARLLAVRYNFEQHKLTFEAELPIRLGESVEYEYYWPSSTSLSWPPDDGINNYGPGAGVTGTIECQDP